ncbi:hypothetical protein SISSUDRAFT_994359, partial [Sistotremastrum suecicum HHB10207 ss-3]
GAPRVIVCFVLGILLVISCLIWEWCLGHSYLFASTVFCATPILPFSAIWNMDVVICQHVAFVSGMAMFVHFYFVALFFTIVSNLSATKAALRLVLFSTGIATNNFIGIPLVKPLRQPKIPVVIGCFVLPLAAGLMSKAINSDEQKEVMGFLVLSGASAGLTFLPLSIHARFKQPEDRVATDEALNFLSRGLSGAIGLAYCAALMNSRINKYIADILASQTLSAADALSLSTLSSGSTTSLQFVDQLSPEVARHVRIAFQGGLCWVFASLIPWGIAAAILVIFLSRIEDTDKGARSGTLESASIAPHTEKIQDLQ